jgi:hypothetical protein
MNVTPTTTAASVPATTRPRAQCVNLRATFAGQFRFAHDEAYQAERSDFRKAEACWLTVIPCRVGRIFPWGGRVLAAYCRAAATKRRELAALEGVRVVQGAVEGCPEMVVTFDVELIDQIAPVMQAKRPRRLSPEQRLAAVERLRAHQFPARQATLEGPDSTIGTSGGLVHVDELGA